MYVHRHNTLYSVCCVLPSLYSLLIDCIKGFRYVCISGLSRLNHTPHKSTFFAENLLTHMYISCMHHFCIHTHHLDANLASGGSSLTTKNMGHISVFEERNKATPSVLNIKEMFAGFVHGHRNFPCWESSLYSLPSCISHSTDVLELLCFLLKIMSQKSGSTCTYTCINRIKVQIKP